MGVNNLSSELNLITKCLVHVCSAVEQAETMYAQFVVMCCECLPFSMHTCSIIMSAHVWYPIKKTNGVHLKL